MERVATKLRSVLKPSEEGSFKFAISLIVACLAAVYKIKNYIDSNFLSRHVLFLMLLIVVLLVVILSLIGLSIFFKAMSLERNDYIIRKNQENISKKFYAYAFFFTFLCIFCFIPLLGIIISEILFPQLSSETYFNLLYIGIICLLYFLLVSSKTFKQLDIFNDSNYNSNDLNCNSIRMYTPTFLIISVLLIFIVILVMPFIFTNHLIINVDSVYYKYNQQIPFDISLTGFRSPTVNVNLYRVDFEHLVLIDSIEWQLKQQYMDIRQSDYLWGNYQGSGKFKVFINCSNLTEGYYVISVNNFPYQRQGIPQNDHDLEETFVFRAYMSYLSLNKNINNSFYLI